MKRQGVKLQTRLLRYDRAVAPPKFVRRGLRLRAGSRVGLLRVLRLVDDRIIGYDRRYFPSSIARRFDPVILSDRPITELVNDIVGSPVTQAARSRSRFTPRWGTWRRTWASPPVC